jgi:micrococcal nuclease
MFTRALENVDKRSTLIASGMFALIAVSLIVVFRPMAAERVSNAEERGLFADVKRVVSGHKIKLDTDKPEDEYLVYAGIRAPYPGETAYDESRQRNALLVEGKRVRLRFDDDDRDDEGRRLAYVFTDDAFVNEVLVKEGLAYARITPSSARYEKRLLSAQAAARKQNRGIWKQRVASNESTYPADPKYGTFHRPACETAAKIPSDRTERFATREKALDVGFAPCSKCHP